MKLFILTLTLLAANVASASEQPKILEQSCYKATNPEVIKADNFEADEKLMTSTGTKAVLILQTQADQYSDTGSTKLAKMKISTDKSWKISVWAGMFNMEAQKTVPTYNVECDGGSVTVKKIDKYTMVLNSDYLAGEMTAGIEGCSNARLEFKNLIMKKRASCN